MCLLSNNNKHGFDQNTDYEQSKKPFYWNPKLLGLGRQIGLKFFGIFWVPIFSQFICTHFGTVSPLSMFSISQSFFLQKLSLYIQIPNIWDWDLNLGFSHCVSTVHFPPHHYTPPLDFQTFLMSRSCTKPCKILSPWLNLVNVYMKVRLLWKIFQSIIAPWGITHANPPWFTPRNGLQWLGI